MKITPMAAGGDAAPQSPDVGHSAGADRVARAKAVFMGQSPEAAAPQQAQATDPQVERAERSIKRIKMNTQRSTNRFTAEAVAAPVEQVTESVETAPQADAQGDVLANTEQVQADIEANKPLSPQFAALAKAKRAAQAKEAAIAAREQALAQKETDMRSAFDKLARLKANPLSVLQEEGVTYDQLTESLLNQNQGNAGLDELKAEIKAIKEGFERQQLERDRQAETQVLTQIRKEVEALVADGDDYQLVRESGYTPKVVELMHRVFKETGELLSTAEAAQLVENELIEEGLKYAKLQKIQQRLAPPTPAPTAQPQAAKTERAGTKIMRTLTNRDGSSAPMSPRERAIAAFYGKLK